VHVSTSGGLKARGHPHRRDGAYASRRSVRTANRNSGGPTDSGRANWSATQRRRHCGRDDRLSRADRLNKKLRSIQTLP
jgi:hypothetical protein